MPPDSLSVCIGGIIFLAKKDSPHGCPLSAVRYPLTVYRLPSVTSHETQSAHARSTVTRQTANGQHHYTPPSNLSPVDNRTKICYHRHVGVCR